jgi:ATP-binding cassette, subfamily B, bacterial PglK
MELLKLIWKLLTDTEKKKYYLHITFSVINTFFETFLVALVIPLTQIIMKQKVSFFFLDSFDIINKYSYTEQVMGALILLASIYIIKNSFYAYFLWWQHDFVAKFETRIVKKLFSNYILQPYPFHLKKSSGVLINKISFEVNSLNSAMKAICQISSESLILIAIIICLLVYEPKGTLVVIIFSLIIFLLSNFYLKKKVRFWGNQRFIYSGLSNKELVQSFEGIKEIKLMGLENKITSNFFYNVSRAILWRTKWEVISGFPRIVFELIAVISFCILVFTLFSLSSSVDLIQITALFLAATFRLMPSLVRVTGGYTTFQNQFSPVTSIVSDLNLKTNEKSDNPEKIQFDQYLEIKNLNFKHESAEKLTISNVNFRVKKGEIIGIIGTSGSGKTTLVDLVIGLLDAQSGNIIVDKKIIKKENQRQWQKKIGYVPQSIFLSDETIRGNIAYGVDSEDINHEKIEECIRMSNLKEFIRSLPLGLDTIIGERGVRISGGQRQRIAIARTLYQDPELIIFDEATSALDPKNEGEIVKNILSLRGNKTVVIIAHKFSLIKDCDKILVMDDGKLIKQGKYNEIF